MNSSVIRTMLGVSAIVVLAAPLGTAIPAGAALEPTDSVKAVAVERSAYTHKQLQALLKKPTNAGELLRNLRIIADDALILEPSFDNDEILMRSFSGSAVHHEPVENTGKNYVSVDAFVSVFSKHFPNMTVQLQHGYHHEPAYRDGADQVPAHTPKQGFLALNVRDVPGFSIGAVRDVFGQGSAEVSSELGLHGVRPPPAEKGFLTYDLTSEGPPASSTSYRGLWDKRAVVFVVKRESQSQDTAGPRQHLQILSTDTVASINISVRER